MQDSSLLADMLEIVVRDSNGRVKDYRMIINRHGKTLEFRGNARYLSLLNQGKQPWKVPFLNGNWRILGD